MKTHKAEILDIENLGVNGLAFTVRCCGDPKTDSRHTVHMTHTMTDEELSALFERYAHDAAKDHLAGEHNAERVAKMVAKKDCEVCE